VVAETAKATESVLIFDGLSSVSATVRILKRTEQLLAGMGGQFASAYVNWRLLFHFSDNPVSIKPLARRTLPRGVPESREEPKV
jgi:hypothetical protein